MKTEDLKEVVKGNVQAFDFLCTYVTYCHLMDDIVDDPGSVSDKRLVAEQLAFLQQVILNPWVQQHIGLLWPMIVMSANTWLDANRWEKSNDATQRFSVDVLKGQYHEVAWFTAYLCGGLEHMQEMTSKYREYDYENKEK
jgi:hypothetical protein